MGSILRDIQQTVTIYSDLLAEIIKMDVVIVDADMCRITVSGPKTKKLKFVYDSASDDGLIMQRAISTGEVQIVDNPKKSEICKPCTQKERCQETYHICAPIKVDDETIGVLAFTCNNQRQRTRALQNQDAYIHFVDQFAGLIALKAKEAIENQHHETVSNLLGIIVDRIDFGVLVFDKTNRIARINEMGRTILHVQDKDPYAKGTLQSTGRRISDLDEFHFLLGDKPFLLVGRQFDLHIEEYGSVFLFQDAERGSQHPLGLAADRSKKGINRIVGTSQQTKELRHQILRFSNSPSPVLITGEVGTEKKEIAMALHEESDRKDQVLNTLQCTIVPADQMREELFGLAKPANSRAKGKPGKIELAARGTFVIEEIADMPLQEQASLLRVMEEQAVKRINGDKNIRIGTRFIATSSVNLNALVKKGLFLEQLLYRISVLPIAVQPLRKRGNDIVFLAQSFCKSQTKSMGKTIRETQPSFDRTVSDYPWPGNLWELQNSMEYVANMLRMDGVVTSELLPPSIVASVQNIKTDTLSLDTVEQEAIRKALDQYGISLEGKKKVTQKLGISMATLYRKMKKYNMTD